ncbi:hypothetical protein WBG78_30235 [Chryseolinea sp. T2]|uniref:hypothetical protein n=1 Tax=Chryseolinea sp. T2 TaxID=3129255 RepID=UPI0030773B6A
MEHIKKIGGINLLVLVAYMVLINISGISSGGGEAGLGALLLAAFLIGLQVFVNFATSIVLFIKKAPQAKAFLLSSVIVLVIGFSACLGSAALY